MGARQCQPSKKPTPKMRVQAKFDAHAERTGRKAWRIVTMKGRVLGKHVSAMKAWADAAEKLSV